MKRVLWVLVCLTLLTAVPTNASEDRYISAGIAGYMTNGLGFSKEPMLGLRIEGETGGRLAVFGSLASAKQEKKADGETNQNDFEAGLKVRLADGRFYIGAGGHRSELSFEETGSDRSDTSYLVLSGFRVRRDAFIEGRWRSPDSSRYKTTSAGITLKYFKELSEEDGSMMLFAIGYDAVSYSVPQEARLASGEDKASASQVRVYWAIGWR